MAANKESAIAVDNKMLLDTINKVNDQLGTLTAVVTSDQKKILEQLTQLIALAAAPKPARSRATGASGAASSSASSSAIQKIKVIKTAQAFFINEYMTKEDVRAKWVSHLPEIHALKAYIKVNNDPKATIEAKQREEAKLLWTWMAGREDMTKEVDAYKAQHKAVVDAMKKSLGHPSTASAAAAAPAPAVPAGAPAAAAPVAAAAAPAAAAPAKNGKKSATVAARTKPRAAGKKKAPNAAPTLAETAAADHIDEESDGEEIPEPNASAPAAAPK